MGDAGNQVNAGLSDLGNNINSELDKGRKKGESIIAANQDAVNAVGLTFLPGLAVVAGINTYVEQKKEKADREMKKVEADTAAAITEANDIATRKEMLTDRDKKRLAQRSKTPAKRRTIMTEPAAGTILGNSSGKKLLGV